MQVCSSGSSALGMGDGNASNLRFPFQVRSSVHFRQHPVRSGSQSCSGAHQRIKRIKVWMKEDPGAPRVKSQDHSGVWVGRDLEALCVPPPARMEGEPQIPEDGTEGAQTGREEKSFKAGRALI